MLRFDGKNPMDPGTYKQPAPSIQSMLELRAFCADVFDKLVRTTVNMEEEDIKCFLTLITHSPGFFARARAVIPELQAPDVESSHPIENRNLKVLLRATRSARGPPGKKWEWLPEELAWTQLAKDGMENVVQDLKNHGTGHQKKRSDASAQGTPMIPTWLAPGIAISDSPLRSPMGVKSKPKPLPNKLDLSKIPTFVPRTASESDELVWSPTSGTRKRRPDEVYQQSTKGPPANSMRFRQHISPNVDSLHSIKAQYPFHGSRGLSDDSTKSHRRLDSLAMTPSPGFKSFQSPFNPPAALSSRSNEKPNPGHKRRNNPQGSSLFSSSIDGINYLNEIFSPPSHVDTKAYSVNDLSLTNSPSQFSGPRHPPSQVRGVYGADPFSAPPSVTGYGNQNQPSQSVHRGPPSPFQGQLGSIQSGPDVASFHPFAGQEPSQGMYRGPPSTVQDQLGPLQSGPDVASYSPFAGQLPYRPNPEIRATQSSRPRHGAMPSQMSNQSSQSFLHMMAQTQMPPSMAHAPDNEILSVPPPGSMDPLVHWNLLHQREFEIRTRLQNANRQMTEQEHRYIFQLREARVNAVATQMPARNGMSQGKWLAELGRTLRGIWKTGPGGTGFTPLVVARKMDFEQAVEREIERISQQRKQKGNWSALGRTQGTVPTSTMTYRRELLDQQRRNLQNSTSGRG